MLTEARVGFELKAFLLSVVDAIHGASSKMAYLYSSASH